MRASEELKPAIARALAHLEQHGCKFVERGKRSGDVRLGSYRNAMEDCVNLRELQFHFDLFCRECGCATYVLHTTKTIASMADRGLVKGVLPIQERPDSIDKP